MITLKVSDLLYLDVYTEEPTTNPQGRIDVVGASTFIHGVVWFNTRLIEGVDVDHYFSHVCWTTLNDGIVGLVEGALKNLELTTDYGVIRDTWIAGETDQYLSPNLTAPHSPSRLIHRAPIVHTLNRRPGTVVVDNVVFRPDLAKKPHPHQLLDSLGRTWRATGVKLKRFVDSELSGYDPELIERARLTLKWATLPVEVRV